MSKKYIFTLIFFFQKVTYKCNQYKWETVCMIFHFIVFCFLLVCLNGLRKRFVQMLKKALFHIHFYQIYQQKTCKCASPPTVFWKGEADLGSIANINHQHLLNPLMAVSVLQCLTFSAHTQPCTSVCLDGSIVLTYLQKLDSGFVAVNDYCMWLDSWVFFNSSVFLVFW